MRWGEKWVGWEWLIVALVVLGGLSTVDAAERAALVIGNSGYAERPLRNPPNDARAMAALLQKLGFTVTEKTDLDLRSFRAQVNAFLDQSKGAEVRLFYYSGHGASYDGDNYLLPIGHGVTRKHELPDQAYSLKTLLRGFKDQGGINLVLLDSCRDAPFGDAKSIWDDSKGMKPMQPQEGVLIGYAAQNGRTASDNSGGSNSLYTKYLLQELGQSLELREALMRVRQAVYDESRGEQRPTTEDEVLGKVYLAAAADAPVEPPPVTTGALVIRNSQPPGAVLYVNGKRLGAAPQTVTLKVGQHTIEAKQAGYADYRDTVQVRAGEQTVLNVVLTAVQQESVPVTPASSPPPAVPLPDMVRIAGGRFRMGSPETEVGRKPWEANEERHEVTVKEFEMGRHEVTVGEFRRFADATGYKTDAERNAGGEKGCYIGYIGYRVGYSWRNPNFKQSDGHPVVCVSWNDAQAYVKWLSEQTGQTYRLPTEVEWEYAARAGTATARYWGDDPNRACRYGNVGDRTAKKTFADWVVHKCTDNYTYTAPVGTFEANGWGLKDMLGNVWEWTCSLYDGDYGGAEAECIDKDTDKDKDTIPDLAVRGVGWDGEPAKVRSALRAGFPPAHRDFYRGFRLARSL
ncbi:MAG: SUMF1/EgtB/PvdO family nonheme iron enzyme [Albidovulum sp.]